MLTTYLSRPGQLQDNSETPELIKVYGTLALVYVLHPCQSQSQILWRVRGQR